MLGVAAGTGIVRTEETGIAEPVVHQAEVESAGENVVARIVGIEAEAETRPHVGPGRGHQLHQPHRPRRRSDGLAIEGRSEEHTSELQSLMRISYAVFCLKKKKDKTKQHEKHNIDSSI